jgi:transcription elongation factor Elf1
VQKNLRDIDIQVVTTSVPKTYNCPDCGNVAAKTTVPKRPVPLMQLVILQNYRINNLSTG